MVDPEVFDKRLGRLELALRDLRELARVERDEYLADRALQAQAERWLYLAAECALDLAHHLISDRGWRTPESYRDAFRVLCDEGVMEAGLSRQIEGWAGLRNVLAHLNLEVDQVRLHELLTGDLDALERYAAAVARAAHDA